MKTFKINDYMEVIAESKNTRSGFKHEATLLKDNNEIEKTKINYYNRTWESYEFESVLIRLKQKAENKRLLTEKELNDFKQTIKSPDRIQDDLKPLKMIANFAKLASVLCNDKKDSNDWKTRMLKAGFENRGLIMPDDWDTLSEEEKEIRLNKVIEQLGS